MKKYLKRRVKRNTNDSLFVVLISTRKTPEKEQLMEACNLREKLIVVAV